MFEIRIEIPPASADAAEESLLLAGEPGWSLSEDALAKKAWIVGIFPDALQAQSQWDALLPTLAAVPLGAPDLRPMPDKDWKESYKEHFRPWRSGPLHWVPVWERDRYCVPAGESVLWLDPGMAFGTGNHETTRLCCERLVALAPTRQGARVLDAGCGSGILALSAALLGFGEIAGFDNDAEAVRVSLENAAANGLEGRVSFFTADLAAAFAERKADIVLANIQADILCRFAHTLIAAVLPGGALVLSGILATEIDAVRTAFESAAPGWPSESRALGEWSDLFLTRPS